MSTKLLIIAGCAAFVSIALGVYQYGPFISARHAVEAVTPSMATTTPATWLPFASLPTLYDVTVENEWRTWYWSNGGTVTCMYTFALPTDIDITTFEFSSYGEYAKDKNHVYRCDKIVEHADPHSFVVLNKEYAKDDMAVFYSGKLIPGADAHTFEVVPALQESGVVQTVQTGFGKDNTHVYNLFAEIRGADPETFKIVSYDTEVDKNWVYYNGTLIGPVSLVDETYAHSLPENCTKPSPYDILPSLRPSIFSKDGTVVGYTGMNATCLIDKKTRTSEYYQYGYWNGVALSDDGSQLYYSIVRKGSGGGVCASCGTYSIDRATGEESRISSESETP
jgi:hypothetical protein